MLVLSRKPGERILLGDDIVITVIRIGPNSVRIGIDAPQCLNIVREELERYEDTKPSQENLKKPEGD
jgi:carbon storage regulator